MGQFRASLCPLCGSPENGNWTCRPCTVLVDTHRELIRSLQAWHSWHEAGEVGEILEAIDGRSYCLWDVDLFYAGRNAVTADRRPLVADKMRTAIELCLHANMLERHAAVAMGIKETSPVSIYATIGLTHMLVAASRGRLPGYYLDLDLEISRVEVFLSERAERDEAAERRAVLVAGRQAWEDDEAWEDDGDERGDADQAWGAPRPGGGGERDPQGGVQGGDEASRQERHPHALEGCRAGQAGGDGALGHAGRDGAEGLVPPGLEPRARPPQLGRGAGLGEAEDHVHRLGRRVSVVADLPAVGEVLDLTIRFGNQVRHKCACCKRYFSVHADLGLAACACGAVYERREHGKFEVVGLP